MNLTNPMMMKGPLRELIPAPAQQVSVRLPDGSRARKVRLLCSEQMPRVRETNGVVTLTVPAVRDLEVVAIDL